MHDQSFSQSSELFALPNHCIRCLTVTVAISFAKIPLLRPFIVHVIFLLLDDTLETCSPFSFRVPILQSGSNTSRERRGRAEKKALSGEYKMSL